MNLKLKQVKLDLFMAFGFVKVYISSLKYINKGA